MTRTKNGLRIPDQNLWTGEVIEDRPVLAWDPALEVVRLSYADPRDDDWENDTLWLRHGLDRSGDFQWKSVNTTRTRAMMRDHLCMVCSGSGVDPESGRIWWVFNGDPGFLADSTPVTNVPPTCPDCIPEALETCPRLRRRPRVVTVAASRPYAVTADLYEPGDGDPAPAVKAHHQVIIPYLPENEFYLRFSFGLQPWVALENMRDEPFKRP